jgi:hypothetical protein
MRVCTIHAIEAMQCRAKEAFNVQYRMTEENIREDVFF